MMCFGRPQVAEDGIPFRPKSIQLADLSAAIGRHVLRPSYLYLCLQDNNAHDQSVKNTRDQFVITLPVRALAVAAVVRSLVSVISVIALPLCICTTKIPDVAVFSD